MKSFFFYICSENRRQGEFMKNQLYYYLSFILIGFAAAIFIHSHFEEAHTWIVKQMPLLLKEAVQKNAEFRTENMPFWGLRHEPEKIGRYIKRQCSTQDTTFIYYHKVEDIATEMANSRQRYLLDTRALHSKDVQMYLDTLLKEKGIFAPNAIYICAEDYHKRSFKQIARSAPDMRLINRTQYGVHDALTHISYFAYVDYSFATLWRIIPKGGIYTLLGVEGGIVVLILWLSITKRRSRKKEREEEALSPLLPETIIEQNSTEVNITEMNLSIINVETDESEVREAKEATDSENFELIESNQEEGGQKLCIKKGCLVLDSKSVPIPALLQNVLRKFLESEDGRVRKTKLLKMWSQNKEEKKDSAQSCMTSTIYRINVCLKSVNAPHRIITDPSNKNYYWLSR